ncbi:MAG: PEP-CTERM system TPR-repeat protein PrsT [Colwellia sp.]|uniref:XrtA/PEP-CTERM system TPR-repeat protein PrsT n=1 Tax=Colwellia sp. TaxID=56799 RepID=UPI0025BF5EC7|nr:XrtA/PEP-CTERM system TPR-repeat protein PrsT [Colwellia sp.]NQZ27216.1 PEP-CTERM system TPR-repeat protein PrsT [Colwellia sp.]
MNKIIITSAITLALTLSACSEQKTAEQLMASANVFSQQGKFATAIIDYKNAVRLDPKNSAARFGLGRAYLNQGNYISAEKELERAVALGASFAQTATLLTQVKTRLNKSEEVEQLVRASEDLNDSDYIVILTYAGMSALTDGLVTKAQDYFSQAAAINQENVFSQLASAYLLYSERKFAAGLALSNSLLAGDSYFFEALLLQGYLNFASNNFEQASQDFSRYIIAYPYDNNIRFFQVNTLIKAQKFAQASTLNDSLLKAFENSPLALQYKAQIAFQHGNYMSAREYASQAVGLNDTFVIAKMIAGVSSYKLDELEQAYGYLITLESLLPTTHPINVILLSIKIKLGHTDDLALSVAKLNEIKNNDSDSYLLQITSAELMKAGDYASAQTLINKAVQVSPNNAALQVQQGSLLLSQRDLSGIKSLEQALTIDPSLHDTEFALARQYLRGNEVAKAQVIANKWLDSDSHQVSGNILNGLIAMKLEKVTAAEKYFQNALKIAPKSISAIYNLAIVAAFHKQATKAIAGFKEVIELSPNHHNAIRRYTVLQTRQGRSAEAILFLNALHQQSLLNGKPIHKNLVMGLAQNLRISKQVPAAISLLESIKSEKNLSPRYWAVLAASYTQMHQFKRVLTTYEQGLKEHGKSYILRVGYIGTLEKLKQFSPALALTKKANIDFPDDDNLMTMRAYLELANNNIQATKQQLKVLKDKGVSNNIITMTTAKVAIQEKQYDLAIELYSELYEQVPNSTGAINLARALQFSKQGAEAELVLENYLTNIVNDNRVRMLLAELYDMNNVDNNKSTKIISTYQQIVKDQPNNLAALNNLAWQQYQSDDLVNAQLNIEKALYLAPDNNAIAESYGVILVANKRYEEAIEVLVNVINQGSIDISAKVSLAEAYIALQQHKQAKQVLSGLSAHDSKLNVKIAKLKQEVEQY